MRTDSPQQHRYASAAGGVRPIQEMRLPGSTGAPKVAKSLNTRHAIPFNALVGEYLPKIFGLGMLGLNDAARFPEGSGGVLEPCPQRRVIQGPRQRGHKSNLRRHVTSRALHRR